MMYIYSGIYMYIEWNIHVYRVEYTCMMYIEWNIDSLVITIVHALILKLYHFQVEECITYCYTHISEIVAAPCNMSCIGNHLLTR